MTRVVADTTCGLPPEVYRKLSIPMIPQIINFGDESFREGVDIDHSAFMARLRSGKELPKTAAPYPGDFIDVFGKLVAEGESVVCVHPSTDVSGTVRSAETARMDFPGADIRIIDTRSVASAIRASSPSPNSPAWCWRPTRRQRQAPLRTRWRRWCVR